MTEAFGRREGTRVGPSASARDWLGLAIPILSAVGMLVSAYLTWVHWGGSKALCSGIGDCETVNNSAYAVVAGIPVALLGFGMYLALFGLSVYGRRAGHTPTARTTPDTCRSPAKPPGCRLPRRTRCC